MKRAARSAILACLGAVCLAAPAQHLTRSFAVPQREETRAAAADGWRTQSSLRSTRPASAAVQKLPATVHPAALNVLQGGGDAGSPWAIVLGLTLLTLIPALLLAMTPMVRLLVVFHFLRQALGTNTAPSNQVLMGLALVMTWFLMQPVLLQIDRDAITPYRAGQLSLGDAIDKGSAPMKQYMLRYAHDKDLAVFVSAAAAGQPASRADLPLPVVVPAYMLSELKAGFQIGAVLFLPFLLVDLLVAGITTSIGMFQLSPAVISTPLKILLFVIVDGWSLLTHELIRSFR